jgi:hypothetical protein
MSFEVVNWIELAQDEIQWQDCDDDVTSRSTVAGNILTS